MTLRSLTFATALAALSLAPAMAQDSTTVIRENNSPPSVTIAPPAVSVNPGGRDVTIERRSPETTGSTECRSRSVTSENAAGSTTVTKERCD